MKPMNYQEEVKKPEEQEGVVDVACATEGEASWVRCKDDHEEDIARWRDCGEDDDQREFHIPGQC